jgi:hypothetical protein
LCLKLYLNRSLRPDYWYNLAKFIGPNASLLHDDLYSDNGMPEQPLMDIDGFEYEKHALNRSDLANDSLEWVYEYLTRHILLEDKIVIKEFQKEIAATTIINIINNTSVHEMIEKCYILLKHYCHDSKKIKILTRNRINNHLDEYWFSLGSLAIRVLDFAEIAPIIRGKLLDYKGKYLKDRIHLFSHFGSINALPILREIILKRDVPLMYDLGAVYRSLNPNWEDIQIDIENGRPMSLIALDALWIEDSNQYQRYFNGKILSKIIITDDDFEKYIINYGVKDSAPRVIDAINMVTKRRLKYK